MRFRKYINISRFLRINITKSGVSGTVGPRGLNVNVGKKGAFINYGIPGTGIYDRKKINLTSDDNKDELINLPREQPIVTLNKNVITKENKSNKVALIIIISLLSCLALLIIALFIIIKISKNNIN
jgi:hypothetical protein